MNIAFFTYNFNYYSGAAFQARKLSEELQSECKIFIFSINKNDLRDIEDYNISPRIMVINIRNKLDYFNKIIKYTFKYKIKIYHYHGFFLELILLGNILGVKQILKTTLMGEDDFDTLIEGSNNQIKKYIKLHLIRKIDINIVLSNKLFDINSKYLKNKIIKIPNGVYLPEKIEKKKKNIFCYVGLICNRKKTYDAIKYFIDNYSYLNESIFYIVGPIKSTLGENDKEYIQKCIEFSKKSKKNIVFTDKLKSEEVNKIYQKSKAMIFLSEKEGMPNVVLEAMSHNVVPIVRELDGVSKEIIEDKIDGFIINNEERISEQDIDRVSSSELAFEKIRKQYSIKIIAKKYIDLYKVLYSKE